MADLVVPQLGESISEAVVAKWLKQVGDAVADGEPVAELETDKITVELPSPVAGALSEQRAAVGATVKVGASVRFTGSFTQHPLQAAGGDSPNPIPYVADDQPDDELVVVMPNAGTFGYECEFHPVQMFGAIRVVP